MLDRQQIAREAYDFYNKASITGRPIGPGSPMYSFYDDTSGIYHFFNPSHRHVVYRLAHPEHSSRSAPRSRSFLSIYGQPVAIAGQDRRIEILSLHDAFAVFQESVLRPTDYSYAAVFDMSSPSWMTPVGEWPPSQA